MQAGRALRLSFVLLMAAALSACANLKAVRDFTAQSAQLTGYTDVTNRYLTSPDRVERELPEAKEFDGDRASLQARKPRVAEARDSLFKLHNVVTGYMAALARLAGEDTFNISAQIDEVTGAIKAAPDLGLDADHVEAFATIASKVSSWILAAKQAKEVKAMVKAHGASMDKLLEAMETVTDAMRVELANESGNMNRFESYYESAYRFDVGPEQPPPRTLKGDELKRYEAERSIVLRRRAGTLVQIRRGRMPFLIEERDAVESAANAVQGIRVVRQGHAEMIKNVERLSNEDVMDLLSRAAADLRTIRDNLKKL